MQEADFLGLQQLGSLAFWLLVGLGQMEASVGNHGVREEQYWGITTLDLSLIHHFLLSGHVSLK